MYEFDYKKSLKASVKTIQRERKEIMFDLYQQFKNKNAEEEELKKKTGGTWQLRN